jgi:cytochrome c oxidase subunit 1
MAMATGAVATTWRRLAVSAVADWITTSDHKKIGILYMATAQFFFVVGGFEAFLIRL